MHRLGLSNGSGQSLCPTSSRNDSKIDFGLTKLTIGFRTFMTVCEGNLVWNASSPVLVMAEKKHETKLASYLGALGADHDIAHHG